MKKILFILFLLVLIINYNSNRDIMVFNELNYNPYKLICLDVSNSNMTSINVLSFFSKDEIVSVSIKNNNFYSLDSINDVYRSLFNDWYSKIYLGIKIEKIKINIDNKRLKSLFLKHKSIRLCNG